MHFKVRLPINSLCVSQRGQLVAKSPALLMLVLACAIWTGCSSSERASQKSAEQPAPFRPGQTSASTPPSAARANPPTPTRSRAIGVADSDSASAAKANAERPPRAAVAKNPQPKTIGRPAPGRSQVNGQRNLAGIMEEGDTKSTNPEIAERFAAAQPDPEVLISELLTVTPSAKEGFEPGDILPEIVGKDVEGNEMKLSDYRGQVVMLDFWGDW